MMREITTSYRPHYNSAKKADGNILSRVHNIVRGVTHYFTTTLFRMLIEALNTILDLATLVSPL